MDEFSTRACMYVSMKGLEMQLYPVSKSSFSSSLDFGGEKRKNHIYQVRKKKREKELKEMEKGRSKFFPAFGEKGSLYSALRNE